MNQVTCPKCKHKQTNHIECESCGIIFANYKRFQEKKKAALEAHENNQNKSQSNKFLSLVILAFVIAGTAGATYYFVKPKDNQSTKLTVTSDIASVKQQTITPKSSTRPVKAPTVNVVQQGEINSNRAIAMALKATVKIQTEWGIGSGFFISDSFIVTNRHVVEAEKQDFSEERRNIDNVKKLIALEKQEIRNLISTLKKMQPGPRREQLKIIIKEKKRDIARIEPQLIQREKELEEKEQAAGTSANIRIFMSDGTEHQGYLDRISDNYDLALISISSTEHTKIPTVQSGARLTQGDKVFTIGSPVGLQNTVTAGIFSGYKHNTQDQKVYIQTDAAINPGNSGGPLIDERGHAIGINTMIYRNTEGIGFAIPIEEVFNDFGSSLY